MRNDQTPDTLSDQPVSANLAAFISKLPNGATIRNFRSEGDCDVFVGAQGDNIHIGIALDGAVITRYSLPIPDAKKLADTITHIMRAQDMTKPTTPKSKTNTADALTHLVREYTLDRETRPRVYTWEQSGNTFTVTVAHKTPIPPEQPPEKPETKPTKTHEMWAVQTRHRIQTLLAVGYSERQAESCAEDLMDETWEELEARGYVCLPVTVTLEETDGDDHD